MKKYLFIGLGGLLVVVVALWFFLLRDDAPPPPNAASAAAIAAAAQTTTLAPNATAVPSTTQAATSTTATSSTTLPPTTSAPAGVTGTWAVDTSIGAFADFSSSYVGFRVEEELGRGIGHTTAVGRTPNVDGAFVFDENGLLSATVTADLSSLVTDRSRRDDAVYEALAVVEYPEAVFDLTGDLSLGQDLAGEQTFTAVGLLTIKGVTNEVEIDLVAQLVGEVITVTGQFSVLFADYGVEAPSAPIVVSVEDQGTVEVQLFLTRNS